jgi:ferredoxin
MIVAEQKPLAEIKELVKAYPNLLILGCGTCVKTCFAGGEDEVATLASALRLAFKKDGRTLKVEEQTVERQCEDEFLKEAAAKIAKADAVLSLACGAGAQMVADRYPLKTVLPGVNTTFMGILEKQGLFKEECLGCGNCFIELFNGVCPITRCAKKLFNGPCGGSKEGKCEVNPETDCAWQLIVDRAKAAGKLEGLASYVPAKDWRTSHAGGPRKVYREDHVI